MSYCKKAFTLVCLVTLITTGTSIALAATPKHVLPPRSVHTVYTSHVSHTHGLSGKDLLTLFRNGGVPGTISTVKNRKVQSDLRTRFFILKSHVVYH